VQELDELIRRLRDRVADPERRVDLQPGPSAEADVVDPASLLVPLGRRQPDLALLIGLDGDQPAGPGLRLCASAGEIESIGTVLGVALPVALARALRDVADGGFGPGCGLFGTAELVRITGRCRREAEEAGDRWPRGRLPIADLGDGVLACVATDQPDAPVLVFDPAVRTFAPEAPSLLAWLDEWATAEVATAG
jgi:hypothetical protein